MHIPAPSSDMPLAQWAPEIRNHSSLIKSSIPGSLKSCCSRKQTKPCLSKTPPNFNSYLNIKSDNFSDKIGQFGSACRYFEDMSGKKSFKIQPSSYLSFPQTTRIRCQYNGHALWSWQPAQAWNDPCIFFRARDHDFFLGKVMIDEVWTDGHQQSEAAGHLQELKERHRLQRSTSPPGKEITRNGRAGCLHERKY